MRSMRLLIGLLLILAAAFGCAENGTIQLNSLPTVTVSDGRSTVTLSAYVRRSSGQAVPDNTPVLFSTTLGSIKDVALVQTVNGVARAVLQTGTTPGTAKVTAQALSIGAVTSIDIEFLSDRSLLSSAKEFVEIVAPGYMMFSMDQRIIGASGLNHGVKLRYREIEIDADDIQLNIPMYEVRAKKAHLKMGKVNQEFAELNIKLSARKGVGTTTITPISPVAAATLGRVPWFVPTHPREGIATVTSGGVAALTEVSDPTQFQLQDLSDSTSMVSAKKAVVFPQKKIQFQRAAVMVGGVTVLKTALFEVPLNTASTLITDNYFQIQNNQFNVNLPYYLTLKPGETSLLRLTTGTQYGRTSGVDHGISLNYELSWNRGDEREGGMTLAGLTGRNWDLSAHQYIRFDDRTSATAFFDSPEGHSAFGSLNFNKQFDRFGMSLNSSTTHTIRGNRFDSNQMNFVVERDPMKLGSLPAKFTFGVNASASNTSTSLASASQSVIGVHLRTQLTPIQLGRYSQFNGNFMVTEQTGHNSIRGLAYQANAMLTRQFGSFASAILSYDFLENGFSSGLTGRHQLSFSGQIHQGNFSSNISTIKALDVDRASLFADLGYQLSPLWRLSYSYTLDRYLGNNYIDYDAALGFRLGNREIGLTFSGRTKHFGIQLLGTPLGY